MQRRILLVLAAVIVGAGILGIAVGQRRGAPDASAVAQLEQHRSFITPQQLHERLGNPDLVVVDVRSAEEYAEGHIPGAVNLPGKLWRTPSVKPGQGQSQYIFRKADQSPDIERYEKLLGDAGITRDHEVVIYGNHAGTADGSVPAMILAWLGQRSVSFLDGLGAQEWTEAGYELSREPRTLSPATYVARPAENFVWSLSDVLGNLDNEQVIFYDTRSVGEYVGSNKRDNARGGHIPGAVLCDYAEFLNEDRTTKPLSEIQRILQEKGITPDKQIVLYCQTATRVSLPYLALKDLGYPKVSIYDGSWFEYGNRDDTPVVAGAQSE